MTLSQNFVFFVQRYSYSKLTYVNKKLGGKVYVHAVSAWCKDLDVLCEGTAVGVRIDGLALWSTETPPPGGVSYLLCSLIKNRE